MSDAVWAIYAYCKEIERPGAKGISYWLQFHLQLKFHSATPNLGPYIFDWWIGVLAYPMRIPGPYP
jgi:hypothetical protein